MTTISAEAPVIEPVRGPSPRVSRLPRLLGLGTAVPPLRCVQDEAAPRLARLWGLHGPALQRWKRMIAGTEIDARHAVLPVEDVIDMTTAQRMEAYCEHAPGLALAAASRALASGGVAPARITDLVVVSCTGFAAPGVDVELVSALGLSPSVRRLMIGFMGCFGAISGLRAAAGACAANRDAVALMVCVELCSLHMRRERSVENQVASALFADGAAAAVVASAVPAPSEPTKARSALARLTSGASLLIERGREWMSWRISDSGFAMTLTRDVPGALGECLASFVAEAADARPSTFIIHPGGPGILDAADAALELRDGRGLAASRAVLRRCGNMSSGTVLFVLEEALRQGEPLPAMLLAFGPGLTIESVCLLRDQPH